MNPVRNPDLSFFSENQKVKFIYYESYKITRIVNGNKSFLSRTTNPVGFGYGTRIGLKKYLLVNLSPRNISTKEKLYWGF